MTNKVWIHAALWMVILATMLVVPPTKAVAQEGELRNAQPTGITGDAIVQRFAAKEKEFKIAREDYTWRQSVKVQTMEGNTPTGTYEQVVDIQFDDKGRRQEQVQYAPTSTLERIQMVRGPVEGAD